MPKQITNKVLQDQTGLTRNGLYGRLAAIEKAGVNIEETYGKYGIRNYSAADADIIINWKPLKPGKKRKIVL